MPRSYFSCTKIRSEHDVREFRELDGLHGEDAFRATLGIVFAELAEAQPRLLLDITDENLERSISAELEIRHEHLLQELGLREEIRGRREASIGPSDRDHLPVLAGDRDVLHSRIIQREDGAVKEANAQ